jgi:hypothetical protein
MIDHTRRTFLKAGAAAAIASLTRTQIAHAAGDSVADAAIAPALEQFAYGEVELLEGPMRPQFDANHALFLALNEDMLLKPFRERAGQPAPGEDMGGWYDNSSEFDPHGSFHGLYIASTMTSHRKECCCIGGGIVDPDIPPPRRYSLRRPAPALISASHPRGVLAPG